MVCFTSTLLSSNLQFEEEELAAASQLLRSEVDFVRQAMNHSELETSGVCRGQPHDSRICAVLQLLR